MGLDISHGCWYGAYSAFMRWRTALCDAAGYGAINLREGFTLPGIPWPADDVLTVLLAHSDCDGEIAWEDCGPLAARLEELLPALEEAGLYVEKTQQFIEGLDHAARSKENVEFH